MQLTKTFAGARRSSKIESMEGIGACQEEKKKCLGYCVLNVCAAGHGLGVVASKTFPWRNFQMAVA